MTSDGPAQLLERAALLDAVGNGRSTAVDRITAVQRRAAVAETTARTTLAAAVTLRTQAAAALASANRLETVARARRPRRWPRRAALQTQLDRARATLVVLQTRRPAPPKHADPVPAPRSDPPSSPPPGGTTPGPSPAPPPPPPPARLRRRTTGTPSPSASPVATGASTPATATTAACSSAQSTWEAYGGTQYATRADLATQDRADRHRREGARGPGPGRLAGLRPQPLTSPPPGDTAISAGVSGGYGWTTWTVAVNAPPLLPTPTSLMPRKSSPPRRSSR